MRIHEIHMLAKYEVCIVRPKQPVTNKPLYGYTREYSVVTGCFGRTIRELFQKLYPIL